MTCELSAAAFVVGRYLADKPCDVLYGLARSSSDWEHRTAITATAYFLRQNEPSETFRIAEHLVHDGHDLIRKAVGGRLRVAGDQDRPRLRSFLDRHAATVPPHDAALRP